MDLWIGLNNRGVARVPTLDKGEGAKVVGTLGVTRG